MHFGKERTTHLIGRLTFITLGLVAASAVIVAQTAPSADLPYSLNAISQNVIGAGEALDFHIVKWSTEADGERLAAAWTTPTPAGTEPGGRGASAPAGAPGATANAAPAGGRGRGAAAPAARSPEIALADTLKEAPHVGYFWTSESAGYMVKYARRFPLTGGGSRIILLTDRRLNLNKNWQPATASQPPNTYDFTLIELHLPAAGEGEGKASLTGAITVDPALKSPVLDGYADLPVVMKAVKPGRKT